MKRTPMKRTGFGRINLTQIQALDRAREHLPTAKVHPATRKAVMVPVSDTPAAPVLKDDPVRSEAYRRLVAIFPCKAWKQYGANPFAGLQPSQKVAARGRA